MKNPFRRTDGIAQERGEEVSLLCRTTNTPIVCSCHHTPMWYKRKDAEGYRRHVEPNKEGSFALCDVCRAIDLMWATETRDLLNEREERQKNRRAEGTPPPFFDSLYIEPLPDVVGLVAKAFSIVLPDFNKNPTKYGSICEGKLQLARRRVKVP